MKESPKILCIVPMLACDYNNRVFKLIDSQTIPITETIVILERGHGKTLSERLSNVINKNLQKINLSEFDYLFRLDADVFISPKFLENNLALNADAVGYGQAHLIKISTFIKLMNGKFHKDSDDSYLNYKFMMEGGTWKPCAEKPILDRKAGVHNGTKYFLDRGKLMWVFGYEPLHVFGSFRWEIRNTFCIFGFFIAMLKKVPKSDVAPFVFWHQIRKLGGDLKRRSR